jgi:hypothetical protein
MGPIGIPEIIMIFMVVMMLAIPVGIVMALVWYFRSRGRPPHRAQPPQVPGSSRDRLEETDSLRSRNVVSDSEHEESRRHILSGSEEGRSAKPADPQV